MRYIFAQGQENELEQVYGLIDQRIHWMDEVGIAQWNVTDYWACYPKDYYARAVREHHLYVLKREEDRRVVSVAVLYDEDERWADRQGGTAFYVHHFATSLQEKGAGRIMLGHCEQQAAREGKEYLRLDCAVDNEKLNRYYDQLGYSYAGTCVDGKYTGNRREKNLCGF